MIKLVLIIASLFISSFLLALKKDNDFSCQGKIHSNVIRNGLAEVGEFDAFFEVKNDKTGSVIIVGDVNKNGFTMVKGSLHFDYKSENEYYTLKIKNKK